MTPPPGCCDSSGLNPGAVSQNRPHSRTYTRLRPQPRPWASPQSVDVAGHRARCWRGGRAAAAAGGAAAGGSDTAASEGGGASQRGGGARWQEEE